MDILLPERVRESPHEGKAGDRAELLAIVNGQYSNDEISRHFLFLAKENALLN